MFAIVKVLFFLASFILFYAAVFSLKKSERKLGGVLWLNLSLVIVLCWDSLIAGIINIANIPIHLLSLGIINMASFLGVYLFAKKKCHREKQAYVWDKFDVGFLCVLILGMALFLLKFKGTSLEMVFYNVDAAAHFKNGMQLMRSGNLQSQYFASLWSSAAIEIVMPFIKEVYLYKAFVVVDYLFFGLQIEIFMLVIREYASGKAAKILTVPMTIMYALGFPALNYFYTFFYWGIAMWLIGALVLFAKFYVENTDGRKLAALLMMICCNAIAMCYMLFGPVAFVGLFIYLTYIYLLENKKITLGWISLNAKVFVLPTILAIYYCYIKFLLKDHKSAGGIMALQGGMYEEFWIDFIWVMPLVIYMIIHCVRVKKADIHMVFELLLVLMIIVMTPLQMKGKISSYYFYKFYYPLWFFSYVIAFQAVVKLLSTDRKMVASYGTVFALAAILSFGGIEDKMVNTGTRIQLANHSSQFFQLYYFNLARYQASVPQYSDGYYEACDYVIENLRSEECVPLIADINNYGACYWYEGITGESCSAYYGWGCEFDELKEKIEESSLQHFVVYKDSSVYTENQEYFDSFETCFENDLAKICVVE